MTADPVFAAFKKQDSTHIKATYAVGSELGLFVRGASDTGDVATIGTLIGRPALALGDGAGVAEYLSRASAGLWQFSGAVQGSFIRGTNTQTGTTYTFVLDDNDAIVCANNASAQTYTIPLNASVAFAIGTELVITSVNTGSVSIVCPGGTLEAPTGYGHLISSSNAGATLRYRKRATNTWTLIDSNDVTGSGLSFQPVDSDLTTIAGLTATTGNIIQSVSSAWASVAPAFAASVITSGTMATARLGSGTANSTTYLRGDQTWQTIAGGGDMLAANNLSDLANVATARTNLAVQPTASPTFTGTVAATGGALNLTDGTAAHGKVNNGVTTFGPAVLLFTDTADTQAVIGISEVSGLSFGPGGSTNADVALARTGSAAVALTGQLTINTGVTFADAKDVVLNTTTGTKIGTGTTQKLGFFNATPVAQQANSTDLVTVLSNLGLRATGGNPPLNLGSGALTTTGTTSLGATTSQLSSTPTSKTVDYTLVLGDASAYIVTNKATAIALTIPANASVAFPTGTIIYFYNSGAGTMTLGITSDTLSGTTTYATNTGGMIIKRTATAWVAMKMT